MTAENIDPPSETEEPEPKTRKTDVPPEVTAALRKANKEAETLRLKLKELEDKDKTESERLTSRVTELERDLVTATARADRYEVALDKGLDMVRAKRLAGTTREELEADADELKSWSPGEPTPTAAPGKPTESLKGGGDPTQDPEPNMRDVVESIPRGF